MDEQGTLVWRAGVVMRGERVLCVYVYVLWLQVCVHNHMSNNACKRPGHKPKEAALLNFGDSGDMCFY